MPAITGLIDRLELQELVARNRATDDCRVVYIELTPKAVRVLGDLDGPVQELHRTLIGHLTASELKELSHLLEKARQRMSEET